MPPVYECDECTSTATPQDGHILPVGWEQAGDLVLCAECRTDIPVDYQQAVAHLVEVAKATVLRHQHGHVVGSVSIQRLEAALRPWR